MATSLVSLTGQLISRGGLGSSLSQLFGFGFPGYGASLTLNLPIKNRAAQADMGSALVSRHRDLYLAQQVREQITLEVSNAVHQLELGKLTLAAGRTSLDLAQKALAAAQRKYELGAEQIFFVLDAQTRLAEAEVRPVAGPDQVSSCGCCCRSRHRRLVAALSRADCRAVAIGLELPSSELWASPDLTKLDGADTQVLGVSMDSPFSNFAFAQQNGGSVSRSSATREAR